MNPLLRFVTLPLFDQIAPEHVEPAIDTLLVTCNAALERVCKPDFPAQWQAMARELDVALEQLSMAWGAVRHLNSVADTPALRAAYNAALPRVTEFWTRLGADQRLYTKYKAMNPATLNTEQRKAHQNALRNFVLGGAELEGAARERFAQIQEQLAELSQKFSENALDATDAYAYYAGEQELDGIPQDVRQAARAAAQAEGKQGYKLTLKMPCYLPVMQFATDRALRERLYRAYVTRASDQADATLDTNALQRDNSAHIRAILALRQEEATLLGFPHYAALSLLPKMANSPESVIAFLRDLAHRARPFARQDLADMRAWAKDHLGWDEPQPWDWPFLSEKLKEARFAYSEQEVKPYLPLPRVLQGLFQIAQNLFDIRINPDQAPVWHPSVQFYRIERSGQLVGQFYLDPSARTGKRGGAWMDDLRSRWMRPDTGVLQTPVAHLVCNFSAETQNQGVTQPALLTHDDVTTLFHEFGHGLHHMLTQVDEHSVAGISGVEWDAVELPSQFMENFCWEWRVLEPMTAHVDNGAALPRSLFEKMLHARNFQSGLQTLRQIEFALFDMLLHLNTDSSTDFMHLLRSVQQEVAVIQPPPWSRPAHTFSHIFAGGYAAGYYSYKWAEVLSADAYSAFEESCASDGSPNPQISTKYRREILETGGSRAAMESFKAFRGREPTLDALLRHQGMSQGDNKS